MKSQIRVEPTEEPPGSGVAWAKLVLHKVGLDVTAAQASEWLIPLRSERGKAAVTAADLKEARRQLKAEGTRPFTQEELRIVTAELLLISPEGQAVLREAAQKQQLSKKAIAKIFGG